MGKIFKSVAWGYAGAVLAGLLIAVIGVVFGLSEETVAATAAPTGIVFGLLGLSLVWLRPGHTPEHAKARHAKARHAKAAAKR